MNNQCPNCRNGQRFAVAGIRALLSQGVGAVKAGDLDEAYHCLARVLRADADNEQRATRNRPHPTKACRHTR